jgi:hypothetical protein
LNRVINFEIETAEIVEENPDSQFATAKIRAFSSAANRHDMYCSEEILQKTAPTIYNKPILYALDRRLDDFYTHVNPEDSLIAGFVVPNQVEFERLSDGRLSLNVFAKIWKRYAPKVIQLFQRDSNHKSVSVEMELYKTANMENGLVEMLDFSYAGVTLLGDFITEASPGAEMHFVSFSEENRKFQKAYNFEFKRYEEIDFKIPSSVKDNVNKGLGYQSKGNGGTSVNIANARYLLKNDVADPERVRQIFKKLSSVKNSISESMSDSNPQNVRWMLHGGDAGWKWAKSIVDKMDELNDKTISYFDSIDIANDINSKPEKEEISVEDKKQDGSVKENFEELKKDEEEKKDNVNMEVGGEDEDDAEDKDEKDEEEDDDAEDKDEKDEEEPEKMASPLPFDFADAMSMFATDFENYADVSKVFAESENIDYATMAKFMYKNMSAMKAKMKAAESSKEEFAKEMEELKKFKADKEREQFKFAVDSTLKEIENKTNIPSEKIEALKKQAEDFSLETVDQWKNLARSTALDFATKETNQSGYPIYGLPFHRDSKAPVNGSPWKK